MNITQKQIYTTWAADVSRYIQDTLAAKASAMERLQATASALVRVLPSEPSAQVIGKYVEDLQKGLEELQRY